MRTRYGPASSAIADEDGEGRLQDGAEVGGGALEHEDAGDAGGDEQDTGRGAQRG